jgi:hypothetical protein
LELIEVSGDASAEVLLVLEDVVLAKVLVDGESVIEPHLQYLIGVCWQSGHLSVLNQVDEDKLLVGFEMHFMYESSGEGDGEFEALNGLVVLLESSE